VRGTSAITSDYGSIFRLWQMDLTEALYTTRAMRRVTTNPIPDETAAKILDAAIRAPSGGNAQNWRMVVVTDEDVRSRLAPLYREAHARLQETIYAGRREAAEKSGDEAALRVMRSSAWLAENFEQVPMWVLFFSRNDPSGASIYPAVWNAMLAARGEGVGTCLTTILGIFKSAEVFDLLEIPTDKGWQMAAAVSCGYPLGRWGLAERAPVENVTYADRWGEPLGFEVDGPLWSAKR
jgi:nitroreductase